MPPQLSDKCTSMGENMEGERGQIHTRTWMAYNMVCILANNSLMQNTQTIPASHCSKKLWGTHCDWLAAKENMLKK